MNDDDDDDLAQIGSDRTTFGELKMSTLGVWIFRDEQRVPFAMICRNDDTEEGFGHVTKLVQ